MLSRVYESKGLDLTFYIINSEFRRSWTRRYNNKQIKEHIRSLINLFNFFKINKKTRIIQCGWNKFSKVLKNNEKIIYFESRIRARKAVYHHLQNYINYLLNNNPLLQDKSLLSKKDFKSKLRIKNLKEKYITIGCRHSNSKIGKQRDLKNKDFINLYKILIRIFPEHQICFVCDKYATNYFKKLTKKIKYKFIYSNDYTKNFIEDGQIILNSKLFFQINGGGTMEYAIFSRLPFLISTEENYLADIPWKLSFNQECSWHSNLQKYIRNNDGINGFTSHLKNFL